jgi:hypothetical protein
VIEDAIQALLTGDAGVSALIGTRCYPVIIPDQEQDPTVSLAVYQVISDLPTYTLADGVAVMTARIQFTAWAQTAKAAKQLFLAINAVVAEYAGTSAGVAIANAWIASGPQSNYEPDLRRHRVQADYMLLYAPS